MASFKKLVFLTGKAAVLLLLVAASYCVLLYFSIGKDTAYNEFNAIYFQKMDRLRSTKSPRIVFIGGSNIAFGIDSSKIASEFARPVINMAVNLGLGMNFFFEEAKPHLRENDCVVIVPEYQMFTRPGFYWGDKTFLSLFITRHEIRLLKYLNADILLRANYAIANVPLRAAAKSNPADPIVNEFGDVIRHLSLPGKRINRNVVLEEGIDRDACKNLYNFVAYCEQNRIQCIFMHPSIMKSYFADHEGRLRQIDMELRERIPDSFASTPTDFVFDDDLFFDSVYHLNSTGRQIRTERVIEILKQRIWR